MGGKNKITSLFQSVQYYKKENRGVWAFRVNQIKQEGAMHNNVYVFKQKKWEILAGYLLNTNERWLLYNKLTEYK